MVIQELRKIFWKRKLLLALALVLLFEGLLAWRGADGIFSSTQDKRVYMDLLQSYAGDLTPEKRERLDQELETYEKAQELMVQAEEQYQNGELTSEGFDARTAELAPYRANLAARSDFAEAAQYAEAKPGRTLVNQLAWNELFDTDRPPDQADHRTWQKGCLPHRCRAGRRLSRFVGQSDLAVPLARCGQPARPGQHERAAGQPQDL